MDEIIVFINHISVIPVAKELKFFPLHIGERRERVLKINGTNHFIITSETAKPHKWNPIFRSRI